VKKFLVASVSLALVLALDSNTHADENQNLFTLNEQVWVLFYDVPSRRFRRSRDAFVRRDWDSVSNDLALSAGFIRAEASRSAVDLNYPLENIADRLDEIAENIQSTQISGSDLDAAFARAHWLLAQHYLELSVLARDSDNGRNAGSYLWATAHHMERTVLWSDARMTRSQIRSLDRLRDVADRLRDGENPAAIFKEKPLTLARETLVELGDFMDRKIWIN
jgi:hypothetical protein